MQKLRVGYLVVFCFLSLVFTSAPVYGEAKDSVGLIQDIDITYLAEVIDVIGSETKKVPNLETNSLYQTVSVKFLSGDKKNTRQTITDSNFLMNSGDKVYVRYIQTSDGTEYYSVQEPYRLPVLAWLLGLFVVAVLFFGGKQGFLALIALFISFGVVFKIVFPHILNGGNVVVIATVGALLSLFVVMFVTHGFSRLTISAFLGCITSVLVTVLLAKYVVEISKLSGFASEESVYLNMATKGSLDFVALLVGGIIIGVIGVVDDVAITQASVVNELRSADEGMPASVLYRKALKVGKDHMGAVINTLILAYTGASLPLVLLFYVSDSPTLELINREAIATEIIRAIVGSIGLLLVVPLTTLIAIFLMYKTVPQKNSTHAHHH